MITDVWADAAAACTSVAPAASTQIHRIFRITVISFKLIL
jgi:hypothetical protein